jgi:hypothetical protein
MSISDRILLGLIEAIPVLGVVGIIIGIFEAPKQFKIGLKYGRDLYRSGKERPDV